MSTKNIKAVLREFGELFDEEDPPLRLRKARAELATILKAAKVLGSGRVSLTADDLAALGDACDLMESIAKEVHDDE